MLQLQQPGSDSSSGTQQFSKSKLSADFKQLHD